MLRALSRFFEDLFNGDPVAITLVLVLLGLFLLFGLFWIKIARALREEDEERKHRSGSKDRPR
jgi:hypothetical protein